MQHRDVLSLIPNPEPNYRPGLDWAESLNLKTLHPKNELAAESLNMQPIYLLTCLLAYLPTYLPGHPPTHSPTHLPACYLHTFLCLPAYLLTYLTAQTSTYTQTNICVVMKIQHTRILKSAWNCLELEYIHKKISPMKYKYAFVAKHNAGSKQSHLVSRRSRHK